MTTSPGYAGCYSQTNYTRRAAGDWKRKLKSCATGSLPNTGTSRQARWRFLATEGEFLTMVNCREVFVAGTTLEVWDHENAIDEATGEAHAGSWVWDCALVLAHWLDTPAWATALEGKRVVELGAGTGLPGLVAALRGADVILTDRKALLPGLERNVAANDLGHRIKVRELEWGQDCGHLSPPVDYVLMSDLLYEPQSMPALCKTLFDLSDAHTEMFLAYELRAGTTLCFQEMRKLGISWSKVPNEELHPDWRSEDIGVFRIFR